MPKSQDNLQSNQLNLAQLRNELEMTLQAQKEKAPIFQPYFVFSPRWKEYAKRLENAFNSSDPRKYLKILKEVKTIICKETLFLKRLLPQINALLNNPPHRVPALQINDFCTRITRLNKFFEEEINEGTARMQRKPPMRLTDGECTELNCSNIATDIAFLTKEAEALKSKFLSKKALFFAELSSNNSYTHNLR